MADLVIPNNTAQPSASSPATLAQLIHDHCVPVEEVEKEFGGGLRMLEVIIGGVPNCCYYSAIWPPGAYTYHLLPPNFLNLPHSLTGLAAPKELVALAMVTASRAAKCPYCTAHCVSFAQRRGANSTLASGCADDRPVAQAVEQFATALATVPHTFTSDLHSKVREHLSEKNTEWVALSVAMMGYLAKFMDSMGIELEQQAVNDVSKVLESSEWRPGKHAWPFAVGELVPEGDSKPPSKDSIRQAVKVLINAPAAMRKEASMLKDVPKDAAACRAMIAGYGFDEPLLESLSFPRVRRALAGMLHYNFGPQHSALGLPTKALAGIVFALGLGSDSLAERCSKLAEHHCVPLEMITSAQHFDPEATGVAGNDERRTAVLSMAHAMGPSPTHVDSATIQLAEVLKPQEVIELATFLGVLQLLHRLAVWRAAI